MSRSVGILALLVFMLPNVGYATCSDQDKYTIVYVNGMLTDIKQAEQARYNLELKIRKYSLYQAEIEDVVLGSNPTRGISSDGFKSTIQSYYDEDKAHSLDLDTTNILRALHGNLTTQKILLVGHSQGTFYTNELYKYLIAHGVAKESIAVYNIGTPASYVAGGGKYLTNTTDNVINTVRTATWWGRAHTPLPGNVHIAFEDAQTNNDWRGHSIVDVYLKGEGERIVHDMDNLLAKLTASQGAQDDCFTKPSILSSPKALGEAVSITLTPPVVAPVVDAFVTTETFVLKTTFHAAVVTSNAVVGATAATMRATAQATIATTHFIIDTSARVVTVTSNILSDITTAVGGVFANDEAPPPPPIEPQVSEMIPPLPVQVPSVGTSISQVSARIPAPSREALDAPSQAELARLAATVAALEKLLQLLQQQRALSACDTSLFKMSNCINPFDPGGFAYGAGGGGWEDDEWTPCPPGMFCGGMSN